MIAASTATHGWNARIIYAMLFMLPVAGISVRHCLRAGLEGLSGGVTTNLSGKTRLQDVVDLVSLVSVVVTNDSGLMHIAAAVGSRIIALFGSSTPAYTPPLTAKADVFYLGLSCSPCFKRECPLGHLNCLNKIPVKEVYNACLRVGKGNSDDRC